MQGRSLAFSLSAMDVSIYTFSTKFLLVTLSRLFTYNTSTYVHTSVQLSYMYLYLTPGRGTCNCTTDTCNCTERDPLTNRLYFGDRCECSHEQCYNDMFPSVSTQHSGFCHLIGLCNTCMNFLLTLLCRDSLVLRLS